MALLNPSLQTSLTQTASHIKLHIMWTTLCQACQTFLMYQKCSRFFPAILLGPCLQPCVRETHIPNSPMCIVCHVQWTENGNKVLQLPGTAWIINRSPY